MVNNINLIFSINPYLLYLKSNFSSYLFQEFALILISHNYLIAYRLKSSSNTQCFYSKAFSTIFSDPIDLDFLPSFDIFQHWIAYSAKISDWLLIQVVFFLQGVTCNNFLCILFLVGSYTLNFILDSGRHEEEVKEVL